MQQDLFVPMTISVEQVLFYLKSELPHATYDHSFIIDEMLADMFLGYQFSFGNLRGPKACLARDRIVFYCSELWIDQVLNHAHNLLIQVVATFWPDFVPVTTPSTRDERGPAYAYVGGTDLLIYMPYVEDKHAHVPRSILVPWYAIVNSTVGRKI